MRRSIWVGAGLLLYAPDNALAQQSASISLRGYVPETSIVQLLEVHPIISTDMRAPVRDALVARVLEQSNSRSGYVITLTSESAERQGRAALLTARTDGRLAYRVSYDGAPLQFVGGKAQIQRHERTRGQPRQSNIRITTDGEGSLPAGAYADTLTIAIAAR